MKKILLVLVVSLIIFIQGCNSNNETFVIKDINLELIKCPAGSFIMGSPNEEYLEVKTKLNDRNFHNYCYGFDYTEKQHSVTITKPFYIGKYEVTQKQYEIIMGKNPSCFKGYNNPVESISFWKDAKDFCDKLNIKYLSILPKGYKFDLPTEAQWEYACRAGTNTALNNGKNLSSEIDTCPDLDEVAWYKNNSGKTTHEIGQKKPNAWGIYDMHGNVVEWCRDRYGEYTSENVVDPYESKKGQEYVLRGGCWADLPLNCRSACRRGFDIGRDCFGFRVALVPID